MKAICREWLFIHFCRAQWSRPLKNTAHTLPDTSIAFKVKIVTWSDVKVSSVSNRSTLQCFDESHFEWFPWHLNQSQVNIGSILSHTPLKHIIRKCLQKISILLPQHFDCWFLRRSYRKIGNFCDTILIIQMEMADCWTFLWILNESWDSVILSVDNRKFSFYQML